MTTTAIVDGDAFTLDDGEPLHAAVTLEMDVDGVCTVTTAKCVDLTISAEPESVASAIRGVIAGLASLNIEVVPSATQNPVTLRNTQQGVIGNVSIAISGTSISSAPGSAGIVVDGMSGGVGCSNGSPCSRNADCLSNRCDGGQCRHP